MKMKTSLHFLLSLCFIIFSIYTDSLLCADAEAVFDADGDELRAGSSYYIVSATWGAGGGGLTLRTTGNEGCPITVGQESFDFLPGRPLSIHPANSEESVVRVSTNANIKFEDGIPCARSTVWQIGKFDAWSRTSFVQIGGEPGKPGCDTARSWFKIEKDSPFPNAYKVVFDPSDVCNTSTIAENVSIVQDIRRQRILGLGRDPFTVVFRKVEPFYKAY